MATGDKKCSTCGSIKPAANFSATQASCNSCRVKVAKEKGNLSVDNFLSLKLNSLRHRHRKNKFNGKPVTHAELRALYDSQGGSCAISGLPMHATTEESDLSVSVDRIDNSLGYELGNVRLVCSRLNLMMCNLDDAHFTWWCRAVVNHIGN